MMKENSTEKNRPVLTITYSTPTSVENKVPFKFILEQNSPNPFNPTTTITYTIPAGISELVSLKIHDLRGALVRTLVDHDNSPGVHSVVWDGKDETGSKASSGVYFYKLQAGNFTKSNKMILMR